MSKWCTVATLISAADLPVPFSLAGEVIISTIPDWLKTEDMMEGLGWNDRERFSLCRYALIKEYDAESLGDPDPNWRGATPLSKQSTVLQTIHLANLALWISKPSSVRCLQAFALHASDGTWLRREFRQIDRILTSREESSTELEMRDLLLARAIHSTLIALPIDGTIWVAARTLYAALTTEYWPTRYLLLWVVLEGCTAQLTPWKSPSDCLSDWRFFFHRKEGKHENYLTRRNQLTRRDQRSSTE